MKIFFFHHAGGDKYAFRGFKQLVSENNWEGIYFDYPGHGERYNQPLISNIHEIVTEAFNSLKSEFNEPFVFFGVSMGTLIGYLLAHKLSENGMELPKHFFFASRQCPASHRNYPKATHLESDEFWKVINQYGGCPPALMEHKELREVYEPIIRADFKALENYQHHPFQKFIVPATILYGKEDRFKEGDMDSWQNHFHNEVDIQQFEGGHFFCYQQVEVVMNVIKQKLEL